MRKLPEGGQLARGSGPPLLGRYMSEVVAGKNTRPRPPAMQEEALPAAKRKKMETADRTLRTHSADRVSPRLREANSPARTAARKFTTCTAVRSGLGPDRIYSSLWHYSSLAAKLLGGVTRPKADVYSRGRPAGWPAQTPTLPIQRGCSASGPLPRTLPPVPPPPPPPACPSPWRTTRGVKRRVLLRPLSPV
eukprot:COSAG04_NODE_28_length_36566_cov_70.886665_18_plen_192_part_00